MDSQHTHVISLKKAELSKRGYNSFTEWARVPGHLYIGRKVNYPDVMAPESKWANPFKVEKYGRDECLKLYEEHVRKGKLYADLETLDGKELGCWCHPEPCHGDVLISLLNEKKAGKPPANFSMFFGPPKTHVINLKKAELNKRGYKDFADWAKVSSHIYIGREVSYPAVMAPQSKWANPFKVDKYGRDECLKLYEEYVRKGELYAELETLDGKELGCWCHPEPCHGNVLMKLLKEKKAAKTKVESEGLA